jgi:hypothetical protein
MHIDGIKGTSERTDHPTAAPSAIPSVSSFRGKMNIKSDLTLALLQSEEMELTQNGMAKKRTHRHGPSAKYL